MVAVQSPPAAVTASSIALSGTVTGGAGDVEVSWRSGASSAITLGARAWTATVPLAMGANTIVVTARDAQQNTASASVTVTRQQAQPNTTLQITQPSASGAYGTDADSIAISGMASDSTGIDRVSWTNSRGGGGTATGTTAWSVGPIALLAGQNAVTVTAYGKGGGTMVGTIIVTRTSVPTGDMTNIAVSSSSIVFSGTASDNVEVVSVTWTSSTGGSGAASGTTNWKTASIPLLVGSNTITIRATDAAGNIAWRSANVTRTF